MLPTGFYCTTTVEPQCSAVQCSDALCYDNHYHHVRIPSGRISNHIYIHAEKHEDSRFLHADGLKIHC